MLKDSHEDPWRQKIDMKQSTRKNKNRKKDKVEWWMDAVNRDMKMVGLQGKMADDRSRWRRTIEDRCGDPRRRDKPGKEEEEKLDLEKSKTRNC